MARVILYLPKPEMNVLNQPAQQEYRPVKTQAALIIRSELKRPGMIGEQPANNEKEANQSFEFVSEGAA